MNESAVTSLSTVCAAAVRSRGERVEVKACIGLALSATRALTGEQWPEREMAPDVAAIRLRRDGDFDAAAVVLLDSSWYPAEHSPLDPDGLAGAVRESLEWSPLTGIPREHWPEVLEHLGSVVRAAALRRTGAAL